MAPSLGSLEYTITVKQVKPGSKSCTGNGRILHNTISPKDSSRRKKASKASFQTLNRRISILTRHSDIAERKRPGVRFVPHVLLEISSLCRTVCAVPLPPKVHSKPFRSNVLVRVSLIECMCFWRQVQHITSFPVRLHYRSVQHLAHPHHCATLPNKSFWTSHSLWRSYLETPKDLLYPLLHTRAY